MNVFYPYNEILPRKKAHDVFIAQECSALSSLGIEVTLLCGSDSANDASLFAHYNISHPFHIRRLPLIRKNHFLPISWNLPFFYRCQKEIESKGPDWVILSVLKSAYFHLKRKVKGTRYMYEVHELCCYEGVMTDHKKFKIEKEVLELADIVTVTTHALKEILLKAPYCVKTRIEVVPLAVNANRLPEKRREDDFKIFYVGQLYEEQGLSLLLQALAKTSQGSLHVVGGKPNEIEELKRKVSALALEQRVTFLGFQRPDQIEKHLTQADAFVAPFLNQGRMPYVAHTKLLEYKRWGRVVIAPDLPVVREHFSEGAVRLFKADDTNALAEAMEHIQKERYKLPAHTDEGSWEARGKRYIQLLEPAINSSSPLTLFGEF